MITTKELISKYGQPNDTGSGYLTMIKLPYPMSLSWDMDVKVTRMSCHKLIADKFLAVFNDLLDHYGYEKIVEAVLLITTNNYIITEYTEMMGNARSTATARMTAKAVEMGADAVINVRYMTTSVIGSAAELLVYGTAVKFS